VFRLATCFHHTSYIAPAHSIPTKRYSEKQNERQNAGNIWWEMVKTAEEREMIRRYLEENLCS